MEHPSGFKSAGTCSGGNRILYAWAYDAPGLTLPKGNNYLYPIIPHIYCCL